MGIPEKAMQEALSTVRVRGRCEAVPVYPEMTLLIDYAHNAMSLESLLKTLRKYHPKRLICLFGCGGNARGTGDSRWERCRGVWRI